MKQSNKKTLICVLLCALFCAVTAFAFAGCKKTEAAKKYAVIFMDGETQISEQTVEANKEAKTRRSDERVDGRRSLYFRRLVFDRRRRNGNGLYD